MSAEKKMVHDWKRVPYEYGILEIRTYTDRFEDECCLCKTRYRTSKGCISEDELMIKRLVE